MSKITIQGYRKLDSSKKAIKVKFFATEIQRYVEVWFPKSIIQYDNTTITVSKTIYNQKLKCQNSKYQNNQ